MSGPKPTAKGKHRQVGTEKWHDPMCHAYGQPFRPALFGGVEAPCDCDLIARVRADEDQKAGAVFIIKRDDIERENRRIVSEEIAQAIEAKADDLPWEPSVVAITQNNGYADVADVRGMVQTELHDAAAIARRFKEEK